MNILHASREDQKVLRFSLSWLVNETYAYIERPHVADVDRQSLSLLLRDFEELYASDVSEITLVEGEVAAGTTSPYRELPLGSLGLLKFAVESFLSQVGPVRGEFRIITGLPLSEGESLLSRLRVAVP